MKIHCGQMVEGALKAALEAESEGQRAKSIKPEMPRGPTLVDSLPQRVSPQARSRSCCNPDLFLFALSSKPISPHELISRTHSRSRCHPDSQRRHGQAAQGLKVIITQSLGGTYTVATDFGLARINSKDADALGH